MKMSYTTVTNLQKHLTSKGFYKGPIDNDYGPKTKAAVFDFLESRKGKLTFNYKLANDKRRIIATWQLLCLEAGVYEIGAIDGLRGPSTDYAIEILEYITIHGKRPENWRDKEEIEPQLSVYPSNSPWPLQKDVEKFYGPVGSNQAMLEVPYKHRLAWDLGKAVNRFSIHEKCHDSAFRVLNRVLSHYGPKAISDLRLDLWGGCLNVRPMRGGSRPSMHSYGIAIDYDPERNQLKWGKDRASFARPEYNVWWKLWEEEGWVSLGRARNFDWMHVQAARL